MKLKILFALVIVTLVAGQVAYGQGGYEVRRDAAVMKVAQYANNAAVSNLTFRYDASLTADNADIVQTAANSPAVTIKIGYGLLVTNDDDARGDATAPFTLWCTLDATADPVVYGTACGADTITGGPSATISNKGDTGVITVTVGATPQSFVVAGVRVDASALAVKDTITASITSTTDATSVPLGGSSATGGVSGLVGEVAAGLKVTAAKDAALACSADAPAPSVTVAEGFSMAWGPTNLEADSGGTDNDNASLKIVLANLPDGAKVEWPGSVDSYINTAASGDAVNKVSGVLTKDSAESSSNGKVVVYTYERKDAYPSGTTDDTSTADTDESMTAFTTAQNGAVRSFEVKPTKTTFMGDASVDVSAMLYPMARRSTEGAKLNLGTELSFEAELQAPEKGNGEGWLVISECVTYLLYPFITCGATPGWSTGVSVSNTTADGNVFGAFDNIDEQMGSVVMYGFPRGQAAPAEGMMVEPVVSTVSANLMAGDTVTFDCGATTMAGMEGYAIVRAGFQHARGMAFVLGNFSDGAAVDVSHGYMAEVIDDPTKRTDALP